RGAASSPNAGNTGDRAVRGALAHLSELARALLVSYRVCRLSRSVHMKPKNSSLSRPVTELKYGPTGLSDGVHGELKAAPAYGGEPHVTKCISPGECIFFVSQDGKFDYQE